VAERLSRRRPWLLLLLLLPLLLLLLLLADARGVRGGTRDRAWSRPSRRRRRARRFASVLRRLT